MDKYVKVKKLKKIEDKETRAISLDLNKAAIAKTKEIIKKGQRKR